MRNRLGRLGAGLAAVIVATVTITPPAAHAAPPAIGTTEIAGGLSIPWDIAFVPDGTMLVTERAGRVRVFSGGTAGATLLRTVTIPEVWASGEAGLMGIAVDSQFERHPYVYVCASRRPGGATQRNEVLRYELRGDGSWRNPVVLLGGMAAATTHDGCALEMDPNGFLWVTMGDAQNSARSQDRNSLNGKVLRIHRDGSVPADNPVIAGTRNQVYSMGHRNPQGIAFRPGTGQVYVVEHGPAPSHGDDEVNLLVPGGNYGWPCYTGFGRAYTSGPEFRAPAGGCGAASAYLNPVWASGPGVTLATSGGAFLNGPQWGDWNGNLMVSNLKESDVRRFSVNGDSSLTAAQTLFNGSWGRLRASVFGPGGHLYVTTSNGSGDRVIRISAGVPPVTRLSAANRYGTAAVISQSQFPSGATDVMISTGTNFPDALAGGAAAGRFGMPMLLVSRDSVPAETRAEVDRLNPQRIWILGGAGAVSEAVRADLQQYAPPGQTLRLQGADRYETAVAISQQWYAPGVAAAFVATGTNFPDALAGGPAAALHDSPLLLVRPNEIPPATAQELDRLNPQRIFVLGGSSAVSDAVAAQLQAYTAAPVERLAGANRYATAAAVSLRFWATSSPYVATGLNFPDALAGGAAAGRNGAPLLLAVTSGVPSHTGVEMLRLQPRSLVLLGGGAALDSNAEGRLRALVGNP